MTATETLLFFSSLLLLVVVAVLGVAHRRQGKLVVDMARELDAAREQHRQARAELDAANARRHRLNRARVLGIIEQER